MWPYNGYPCSLESHLNLQSVQKQAASLAEDIAPNSQTWYLPPRSPIGSSLSLRILYSSSFAWSSPELLESLLEVELLCAQVELLYSLLRLRIFVGSGQVSVSVISYAKRVLGTATNLLGLETSQSCQKSAIWSKWWPWDLWIFKAACNDFFFSDSPVLSSIKSLIYTSPLIYPVC